MKRLAVKRQGDIKYPIKWTTLGQYLEYLQHKGVTPERRFLRRSDDGSRARAWREGRRSDAGAARADAGARSAGDEGGRARRRLGAHLFARDLRRNARADRARQRGRQVRRNVHQPHALRREQAPRSDRRADHDQPRIRVLRPKSIISSRRASRIGASSTPRSRRSRRRARPASGSPPTCTPTRRARRGSTRPCRHGCSPAGSRRGKSG